MVISEEALIFCGENREIIVDQLYWIASLARRRKFNLGILPVDSEPPLDRSSSFTIYMSPHESVDDLVAQLSNDGIITPEARSEDVQRYIDQFHTYRRHSWRGDQAIEFVEGLAREMSSDKPSSIDDTREW
ncbi:hypothetical protein HX744_32325 [Pseudonocardia sp. ICBG1122]|nr:hypothetical protein [Pseudonocardia pini]